jgi:hypothetical protein
MYHPNITMNISQGKYIPNIIDNTFGSIFNYLTPFIDILDLLCFYCT